MSQKLTLAVYLEGRGSVKSLTKIEADVFGVPYPLVLGWPVRHGSQIVTEEMLEELGRRIARARSPAGKRALRALESASRLGFGIVKYPVPQMINSHLLQASKITHENSRAFPTFTLRSSKRSLSRAKRSALKNT